MKKIVLASGSPRRKMLLEWAEIPFEVIVSDVDETFPIGIHPPDAALLIAKNKNLIDKIKQLIPSWSISIDASTAETYSKVRGGDWNALLQGLEYIKTLGRSLSLNFVIQKNNWHEIEKFAEFANEYNANVQYSNLLDWGHWTIKWWHDNNVLDRLNEHYHPVLESLAQVQKKYTGKIGVSTDIIKNLKKIEHS